MFHRIAFESGIWGVLGLCLVCGVAGCGPIEEEENDDDSDTTPDCEADETTRDEFCRQALFTAYATWCACGDEQACGDSAEEDSKTFSICDDFEWAHGEGTIPNCIPDSGQVKDAADDCLEWLETMSCDDETWVDHCDLSR